jgi:MutS domain V
LPYAIVAALVLVFLVWSAGASRRARARRLEELRAGWGRPRDRVRRMEVIAEYHQARASADGQDTIDDRTWADLLMDAVFTSIDRTESTLGQQALYHRLRSAPTGAHLEVFEALVERMTSDVPAREHAQAALTRLRNPAGYDLWWLAQPDAIETRPWHVIFPIVGGAMLLPVLLAFVWPGTIFLLLIGATLNLYIRVYSARRIGALIGSFRLIEPLLAAADAMRSLAAGGTDRGVPTMPTVGSLGDDLKQLTRLRGIARWVGRDPIAAGELAASLFEYLNLLFLLDANALYFGARELRAHGGALLRVIGVVGDVDAALSVASLRAGTTFWTRPTCLTAGAPSDFSGLRHPLVDEAVPNSIALGPPYGVLITGSNMSGKSTFVRTVGVNVILAQTIHTCFASAYQSPVLRVQSCIGRSDDLLAGKSYYLVEVESVLSLVKASAGSTPYLFLLDELFRGTNAVERIAAAEAVLSELVGHRAGAKPHLVITATHDAELVDLLRETYEPFHLADSLGADGLVFEYRLRRGPATTRNAITLLRLKGAPDSVVSRALERAAALDEQRDRATSTDRAK